MKFWHKIAHLFNLKFSKSEYIDDGEGFLVCSRCRRVKMAEEIKPGHYFSWGNDIYISKIIPPKDKY